jgi:assimilatory nitrate reductase catalytic subunit
MRARGGVDEAFVARHVSAPEGFWDDLASDSGVDAGVFAALLELVAAHPRMVTLFSQGANQSVCGTDKGNAIINLHLATGRIGQPGMGPFSITGQPNAMGGREVGGLANTLAVHMGFSAEERDCARRFWDAPAVALGPGLKAVDLFRAVDDGRIKFIWVMATNPAVSMPDAGFVRAALAKCPMVVVSDCIEDTDTAAFAHIKLPALGWGEKDGTVTNSERMISRQRALFPPAGEAQADWAIVAEVGRRLGWGDAFGWTGNAAVFDEFCRQTAFENHGARKLDLAEWVGLSRDDYDALAPRRWAGRSPFADLRFATADGKARLVAVTPPAAAASDPALPMRLNTGRYRDQWHTMTRTGLSPKLSQHRREPLVEVHPEDAAASGLTDGGFARVTTASGSALFRVSLDEGQRRGSLFVPMHWTDQTSSGGRANRLPDGANDPVSGQPGFKNTAATIAPAPMDWRGFLVARAVPALPGDIYWTAITQNGGVLIELAGAGAIDVEALLPPGPRAEAFDPARGTRRIVVKDTDGTLAAALYLTRSGRLPSRDWIASQLVAMAEDGDFALLAGRPAVAGPDRGPIVCVCFDVGENTLCSAIAGQSLGSVEAVGAATHAGTNCGSCRPAIARLLARAA